MIKAAVVFFIAALLAGCAQPPDKKPESSKQERSQPVPAYQPPSERPKYKPPDGGFGTLDDSRETRKEVQDQEKESKDAMDQTE